MTNNDKVRTTLRINKDLDEKLIYESQKIGISKNAFIILVLSNKLTEISFEGKNCN